METAMTLLMGGGVLIFAIFAGLAAVCLVAVIFAGLWSGAAALLRGLKARLQTRLTPEPERTA